MQLQTRDATSFNGSESYDVAGWKTLVCGVKVCYGDTLAMESSVTELSQQIDCTSNP